MHDQQLLQKHWVDSLFFVQVLPNSRKDDGDDKDGEWWSSALGDGKTVVSN